MSPFVSAQSLRDDIYHGHRQTVLGAFWEPAEGAGLHRFESEHVPTALFCDPAYALAGVPSSEDGRNPLPEPHHLQDWFRRWGLSDEGRVVVYDEGRGLMAARTWWICSAIPSSPRPSGCRTRIGKADTRGRPPTVV